VAVKEQKLANKAVSKVAVHAVKAAAHEKKVVHKEKKVVKK
jgi:hypothetical protein